MSGVTVREARTHDLLQAACNQLANQSLSKREKVALEFISTVGLDSHTDEFTDKFTDEAIAIAFSRADNFLRISRGG